MEFPIQNEYVTHIYNVNWIIAFIVLDKAIEFKMQLAPAEVSSVVFPKLQKFFKCDIGKPFCKKEQFLRTV